MESSKNGSWASSLNKFSSLRVNIKLFEDNIFVVKIKMYVGDPTLMPVLG